MRIKIDLPDRLVEQLNERQICEDELKAVTIAALEILLAQDSTQGSRFGESAVPFVRWLIAENCELFDALARRCQFPS
jgi:hypothetical protein